jgi:hypothetical protein
MGWCAHVDLRWKKLEEDSLSFLVCVCVRGVLQGFEAETRLNVAH